MDLKQGLALTPAEAEVREFLLKYATADKICRAGWPDFAVLSTPPVAIEVKWGMDKLSRPQRRIAKILLTAGLRYYIVRVLQDKSLDIVELGGRGRVGEADLARAVEGISKPSSTRRSAATKARVEAVLMKYAEDQTVDPALKKSNKVLAKEAGLSKETFVRHKRVVERDALLLTRDRTAV